MGSTAAQTQINLVGFVQCLPAAMQGLFLVCLVVCTHAGNNEVYLGRFPVAAVMKFTAR
jgi:hypothetical protein